MNYLNWTFKEKIKDEEICISGLSISGVLYNSHIPFKNVLRLHNFSNKNLIGTKYYIFILWANYWSFCIQTGH